MLKPARRRLSSSIIRARVSMPLPIRFAAGRTAATPAPRTPHDKTRRTAAVRSARVRFVRGCDIGPDGGAGCVRGGTEFATGQPEGVDLSEILFRPIAQEL